MLQLGYLLELVPMESFHAMQGTGFLCTETHESQASLMPTRELRKYRRSGASWISRAVVACTSIRVATLEEFYAEQGNASY